MKNMIMYKYLLRDSEMIENIWILCGMEPTMGELPIGRVSEIIGSEQLWDILNRL